MRVLIAGTGSALGDATTAALEKAGHEVIGVGPEECDLRDFEAVKKLADELGDIDGLLHLVGGWRGGKGLEGQTDEDYRVLESLIVTTLRNTTRAFLPALSRSSAGRVAIVSPTSLDKPTASNANYLAVKAAAETWMACVAHALRDTPGEIHIERVMALYSDADREASPEKDFSRFTHVDEVAAHLTALFPATN